ncbi:hypothetical protein SAMN05444285_14223 [Draconibacterium orientale]|uniref:Uncharacterized protein n=1 Tax=Draconibacterium orientale TaxID=1168034 RepID=X5DM71_9BACT|nr:hypothetical protein [Draconibacterium orientale]AHW61687.1 hypothetical protein FH5T_06425 [Draconibacterium orientale]SEU09161.1 hypothetical protein SAMN05444285_14223 [Draconibacterium orientale]
MKTIAANYISLFFLLVLFFAAGCHKEDDLNEDEIEIKKNLTDGFCMTSNGEVVLTHNDFEYYDYSAHLIYLKDNMSFVEVFENLGEFTVLANEEEIYSGETWPLYLSSSPHGPIIGTHPSFYSDNIVPIGLMPYLDSLGNFLPDPREDERIVDALKKYNQFHAGLSCEITSVDYVSSTNVIVKLLLKNNDDFNYYYIDPEKTGIGLFHYFTNGLFIRDFSAYEMYGSKTEVVSADPWNSWDLDWLSVINGNESKEITIAYSHFEAVPPGQYKATFEFPGLSFQVSKAEINQDNGLIWLGSLKIQKDITIE